MGLVIIGDIMLGRHQEQLIEEHGMEKILSGLKETIGKRKIVANLECPLFNASSSNMKQCYSRLHAKEKYGRYLFENGFKVLSLANNHIFDFGLEGFLKTQSILNENSIKYFGAGLNKLLSIKPAIIDVNNFTVGFLGFSFTNYSKKNTPGVAFLYDDTVEYAIKKVRDNVDFLIIMPHSGIELYQYPLKRDQKIYRMMIELGADLIVGNQSHCVQAMEIYLDKYIYYSIGDLLFDHFHEDTRSDFSSDTSHPKKFSFNPDFKNIRYSLLLKIDIINGNLKVKHFPIMNKNGYNPVVLKSLDKKKWLSNFSILSDKLKNSSRVEKERTRIEQELLFDLKNRGVI